ASQQVRGQQKRPSGSDVALLDHVAAPPLAGPPQEPAPGQPAYVVVDPLARELQARRELGSRNGLACQPEDFEPEGMEDLSGAGRVGDAQEVLRGRHSKKVYFLKILVVKSLVFQRPKCP